MTRKLLDPDTGRWLQERTIHGHPCHVIGTIQFLFSSRVSTAAASNRWTFFPKTVSALYFVERHSEPLPLRESECFGQACRLTEEKPREVFVPEERVLLERKAGKRAKISSQKSARNRCVIHGILPYVKIQSRIWMQQLSIQRYLGWWAAQ